MKYLERVTLYGIYEIHLETVETASHTNYFYIW